MKSSNNTFQFLWITNLKQNKDTNTCKVPKGMSEYSKEHRLTDYVRVDIGHATRSRS